MAQLHPTLELAPMETADSYVSRLAALHGRDGMTFCGDFGVSIQHVWNGDPVAVTTIERLAGLPAGSLAAWSIRQSGDGHVLRDEPLYRSTLRRERMFVCPHCIAEDVARSTHSPETSAYTRAIWQLVHIRACPTHLVPLVEIDHCTGLRRNFASSIAKILPMLPDLIEQARPVPPSGLESYLTDRLEHGPGTDWIDRLEFSAAARFSEYLGAVATRGHDVKVDSFSEADWRVAGDAGYRVVAGGEPAIWAFLSELWDTYPVRTKNQRPQAILGPLNEWLRDALPSQQPIIDLIFRHTCATTPVGPGEIVLGRPVTKRILHSVHTAALEYDVHPKRLKKLLVAAGVVRPEQQNDTDNAVRFDARKHHPLLKRIAGSMSLTEVETYLGAGRVQTKLLYDHGFIKPFISGGSVGTLREHAFARDDLDAFMARLEAGAVQCETFEPPIYRIADAARRANRSAVEVLEAILDGTLEWKGKDPSTPGYAGILVDLSEITILLCDPEPDGLPFLAAAKRLGLTPPCARRLVDAGILRTETVRSPKNRCPMDVVPLAAVKEFETLYITPSGLSQIYGVNPKRIVKWMSDAEVVPRHSDERFGTAIFDRQEAVAAMRKRRGLVR